MQYPCVPEWLGRWQRWMPPQWWCNRLRQTSPSRSSYPSPQGSPSALHTPWRTDPGSEAPTQTHKPSIQRDLLFGAIKCSKQTENLHYSQSSVCISLQHLHHLILEQTLENKVCWSVTSSAASSLVANAVCPSCHRNSLVLRKGCGCLNSHL